LAKRPIQAIVVFLLLLPLTAPASYAQNDLQAVFDEIIDLYKTHDVVLFGEMHDAKLNYDFRLALLKYRKFADTVQDIVIESGNSFYQDILDDFILKLRDVPVTELQVIWRNTTMPTGVWDPPIYEAFIRTVREVNASRGPDKRLRLLAGDPPVDWKAVTTGAEFSSFLMRRDEAPFGIIDREVVQKGRKALVIYGGMHLIRAVGPRTIRVLLDEKYPGKAYSLIPWSVRYNPVDVFQGIAGVGEAPAFLRLDGPEWTGVSAKRIFRYLPDKPAREIMDAILYLGSGPDETIPEAPEALNDAAYQNELKRRRNVLSQAMTPNAKPPVKKKPGIES
jgi:hypothetical protein